MYNFCMGSEFNYGFNENFHRPKLTFPNIVGFCLCRVLQFFPMKFCTNEVNYDFFFFTIYSLEMAFLSISLFIHEYTHPVPHTHTQSCGHISSIFTKEYFLVCV